MMYPRLKLARNLLKENGVIFASINDKEFNNLKKICDEIFGETNFVDNICVLSNPRGNQSKDYIATSHEYILIYAKSKNNLKLNKASLPERQLKKYKEIDQKGKYRLLGLRKRGAGARRIDVPTMYFPIYYNPETDDISLSKTNENYCEIIPKLSNGEDGRWRWSKEKIRNNLDLLVAKLVQGRDEWDIYQKDYLKRNGSKKGTKYKSIWTDKKFNYEKGKELLKKLLDGDCPVDYPKPIGLLSELVQMGSNEKDIILDFFSGSGTTGHAVMKYNFENSSDRKFIMVQLPEQTPEKSDARKAGYETISDIGKERIKRAGEKIKEKNKDSENIVNLDTGFKVFKLDSSNIKTWDVGLEDNLEQNLFDMVDNIKDDRAEEDILYELLLKYGLDLTLPIEKLEIKNKNVYVIGFGALVICLDKEIDLELVEEIGKLKEEYQPEIMRVVFKDSGFKNDVVKTNAIQILDKYNIDDVKSL